jgi:hypothetical protein
MRRRSLARSVLATTLLLTGSSCAHRSLPLPRLEGETVTLKVAYVVNPRFPSMKPEQIRTMLAAARRGVSENFGVDV